jgi:hypothetical protein
MKISLGIKELDLCAFFCFATSARKVVFGISNSRIESNNNIAIVYAYYNNNTKCI